MALTITTLDILNVYINGVMDRANHHAQNVDEIVLTLAGAVIWKITQNIEVRTYNNETANILWLVVGENRYALTFNHAIQEIELRERTQNGGVIATFSNSTTAAQVKAVFAIL